jgi:predicted esterase
LTFDARSIAVRSHGRYLIDAPDRAVATLVGFHGYQESAAVHLEVLRRIAAAIPAGTPGATAGGAVTLISIQALNRFYARAKYDTPATAVVAGWMTTEDRELVIADNIAYVAAVLAEVAGEIGLARPLVYAGFSQGVAMAYRAAAFVQRPCDGVIALAGDVPPDVAPVAAGLPAVLIGQGTEDKWYTAEKLAKDAATLRAAGVSMAEHVFAGGHTWGETFVARAGEFLSERIAATTLPSGD